MPTKTGTARVQGLDTLRALAIVAVLMYHYGVVVQGADFFGTIGQVGWAGVDLFFVLSGYLIGHQILQSLASRSGFSLPVFFVRRLLRTLPAYYAVLAAYLLFPAALNGSNELPFWRFVTFTQNFGLHYGETFTHSWSLCIEEQFYLVLPVVFLAVARCRSMVRMAWCAIAAGVLAAMLFRGVAWSSAGHDPFSAELYYSTFARFDELLAGVAIAMLRNFHRGGFDRLLEKGNLLLAAGACTTAAVLACLDSSLAHSFFMTTFGFPLVALGCALLVLSALSPTSLLNRVQVPGAGSLALWSYCVYLAHKPVYKLATQWLAGLGVDTNRPLAVTVIVAAGVGGGWLLFRLVETPFMQLRGRWLPTHRKGDTQAAAEGARNAA